MPFSVETLKFLDDNTRHNSRQWYQEHKDRYERFVLEPMYQFLAELTPAMLTIDRSFCCEPKRMVSRIYRDMRYCYNKSLFHRSVWSCFMRSHTSDDHSLPGFFLEIAPEKYSYGCGFYMPGTCVMNSLRDSIIKKDEVSRNALTAFNKQKIFQISEEIYKRDHFPDQPQDIKMWLNRRDICLIAESENFERLFSNNFAKSVLKDFRRIVPVYEFFLKAGRRL
ncbi:MAG: DUF2461 domain-containing protein [Planctomycetia bacterium]|nr:DUF2461 domain-containing protein [Planctomycetia bacterium]